MAELVWMLYGLVFSGFGVLMVSWFTAPARFDLKSKHVLITGGSSGIGKETAKLVTSKGAHVTIAARNKNKLTEALAEIEKCRVSDNQKFFLLSVDVGADYHSVEAQFQTAVDELGPVDVLINSAGYSQPLAFEDIPPEDFEKMLKVNVLGSIYPTRAVIGGMKAKGAGRIVYVSSQAGQLGVFGYTAYSASKFALRGLAEALQMEVKPYGIRVSLVFPPDTDTPMLEKENQMKPTETKLISETSGVFQADTVAADLVAGLEEGRFFVTTGLDGFMLANATAGMSPVSTIFEGLVQVATCSIFRLVSLAFIASFDHIVARCAREREERRANASANKNKEQ